MTSVAREKDLDASPSAAMSTVRRDQNRLFWNAHWVGTHAPIDGVLRDGLGGATNVRFQPQVFRVQRPLRSFRAVISQHGPGVLHRPPEQERCQCRREPDAAGPARDSSGRRS